MLKLEINNRTRVKVDKKYLEGVVDVARKILKIRKNQEVSLAFVSPQIMKKLNKAYRGKDSVTDVLSFGDEADGAFIGEILICLSRAKQQAKFVGWSLKRELVKLLIHGYLHLLGYDHEKLKDALKMEKVEDDILNRSLGKARDDKFYV